MPEGTEQRRLAAIMFTDMVGYSALAQSNDQLALELLEEHREILRAIFPRFHGSEIKTIGDAFLVEFNSALEAAQCAVEIQRTLAKRNADSPAERQIQVRIGVHIGDVVHRGGDVYGDGVNIAARIEPLAGAGGICVSMDVERQIRNALETRFEKLAPTELKNISVPMDLFRIVLPWERKRHDGGQRTEDEKSVVKNKRVIIAVVVLLLLAGLGWWWTTQRSGKTMSTPPHDAGAARTEAATIPEKSVAVLPFENLSEDKPNAFFASGIQDEILTRLAKINSLKVISRTSTQQYQSKPESVGEIAKQLGVAHILEGSVQKAGNAVHINVQLIKAATDAHLWAESYNRKLDDIFAVEAEVATAIADQLNAKLSGSEKEALAQKPTDNPAAYEAYLRGLTEFSHFNEVSRKASVQSFEEAVRLDPKFALAWATLSRTHSITYLQNYDRSSSRSAAAESSLAEAIRLQPQLAETQLARAWFQYCVRKDYKGALELLRNLRITWPSNDEVVALMGYVSARMGEYKKAADYVEDAIILNPRDAYLRGQAARIRIATRDFAGALRLVDDGLQIWPDDPILAINKITIFQARGDLVEAQSTVDRMLAAQMENPVPQAVLTVAYQWKLQRTNPPTGVIQQYERIAAKSGSRISYFALAQWADFLESSGDRAKSQAAFARLRDSTQALLEQQSDNPTIAGLRAYGLARLGEREAALTAIDAALTLAANDARVLGGMKELKARLLTRLGDKENAISLLQELMANDYDGYYSSPLTPALLRLDPDFDSLRGDPRFEKLAQSQAPQ